MKLTREIYDARSEPSRIALCCGDLRHSNVLVPIRFLERGFPRHQEMMAKGVQFSMPPTKQDFGGLLAQFVDSEGAHCSVGGP